MLDGSPFADHVPGNSQPLDRLWTAARPFEPEMVLIPAGEFLIGSDPEAAPSFENTEVEKVYAGGWDVPHHTLYLPDYYMARTPLTNAQYAAFLQDTDHPRPRRWRSNKPPKGKEFFPVVYVSWHDAIAYCRWLSESTSKHYRLPTEAEWEKAASWDTNWDEGLRTKDPYEGKTCAEGTLRARKRRYPWGGGWEPGRCNTVEAEENGTTPVDAYPQGASPYDLLDMAGNVWEWTASLWGTDWYKPGFQYPYDPTDGRENLEAGDHLCRVLRGGSFAYTEHFSRCAYRYRNFPESYSDGIGFRVALQQG
jgi:formylglycine-generating enzyme required for sulfatase activity